MFEGSTILGAVLLLIIGVAYLVAPLKLFSIHSELRCHRDIIESHTRLLSDIREVLIRQHINDGVSNKEPIKRPDKPIADPTLSVDSVDISPGLQKLPPQR